MGGIPHDLYGMTTTSVREYVVRSLAKLGLKEEKMTKVITGGPDGDLGSNEILMGQGQDPGRRRRLGRPLRPRGHRPQGDRPPGQGPEDGRAFQPQAPLGGRLPGHVKDDRRRPAGRREGRERHGLPQQLPPPPEVQGRHLRPLRRPALLDHHQQLEPMDQRRTASRASRSSSRAPTSSSPSRRASGSRKRASSSTRTPRPTRAA